MDWWLPNDEAYPPIIRSIRKFAEERTSPAKNVPAEDLRDMKAIFASLNLDDGMSNQSPTTTRGGKVKAPTNPVAVAPTQGSFQNMTIGDGDGYELGFDDGQGFWDDNQGGGTYGIPKTGGYP